MTNDELDKTVDELEKDVLDELERAGLDPVEVSPDNPNSIWKCAFPYSASFTLPGDDHHTTVTIHTTSIEHYIAKDEDEVRLQKEISDKHVKESLCNYIKGYVVDELWKVEPGEGHLSFLGEPRIERMTEEEMESLKLDILSANP